MERSTKRQLEADVVELGGPPRKVAKLNHVHLTVESHRAAVAAALVRERELESIVAQHYLFKRVQREWLSGRAAAVERMEEWKAEAAEVEREKVEWKEKAEAGEREKAQWEREREEWKGKVAALEKEKGGLESTVGAMKQEGAELLTKKNGVEATVGRLEETIEEFKREAGEARTTWDSEVSRIRQEAEKTRSTLEGELSQLREERQLEAQEVAKFKEHAQEQFRLKEQEISSAEAGHESKIQEITNEANAEITRLRALNEKQEEKLKSHQQDIQQYLDTATRATEQSQLDKALLDQAESYLAPFLILLGQDDFTDEQFDNPVTFYHDFCEQTEIEIRQRVNKALQDQLNQLRGAVRAQNSTIQPQDLTTTVQASDSTFPSQTPSLENEASDSTLPSQPQTSVSAGPAGLGSSGSQISTEDPDFHDSLDYFIQSASAQSQLTGAVAPADDGSLDDITSAIASMNANNNVSP